VQCNSHVGLSKLLNYLPTPYQATPSVVARLDLPDCRLQSDSKVTILRWLKQPGDAVSRGDALVEVALGESAIRVTWEPPAEEGTAGILGEILTAAGESVAVGTGIARIHVDFLGRFLLIAENLLASVEQTIDCIHAYFDPRLAPAEMLDWLGSWVALRLDETWPVAAQRELIAMATTLYRWRGTARGMRAHLRLLTGYEPTLVENFDGLPDDARGQSRANWLTVIAFSDSPDISERAVRQVIEFQKPAHVAYTLFVESTSQR
jgi:phage tail-like protein